MELVPRIIFSLFVLLAVATLSRARALENDCDLKFTTRDFSCVECKTAVARVNARLEAGDSVEEILAIAKISCRSLGIAGPDVCDGMIDLSGPEVVYVLNNTEFDSATTCGFLLAGDHCKTNNLPAWNITIPGNKPAPSHPEPTESSSTIKILYMSDVHIDLEYVIAAPDECSHPLCCRNWGDPVNNKSEPAGYWGAKGECDVPVRTFEALLDAAKVLNPDIVYVAGDLPAHDVWLQNHSSIINSVNVVTEALKSAFPSTTVVMALGNHESAPVNSFSIPATYDSGFTMEWLYTFLDEAWAQWVPTESRPTLIAGGYYSLSPFPGLVVASLNMNFCNNYNWFLLLHNEDPVKEMDWLIKLLQQAETDGDKVHLVGHISPGSGSCEASWSHVYNQIVTRYESTITGQFYGHSHKDGWQIFWDVENDTIPVSIGFIPGSVTAGGEKNPQFKIVTVDAGINGTGTWALMNFESYAMNISIANQDNSTQPTFSKTYDALDDFDMDGLSPQSWTDLTYAMTTDDDLFDEYMRHHYNYYADPPEIDSCSSSCRKNRICDLVTSESGNDAPCQRVEDMVDNDNGTVEFFDY